MLEELPWQTVSVRLSDKLQGQKQRHIRFRDLMWTITLWNTKQWMFGANWTTRTANPVISREMYPCRAAPPPIPFGNSSEQGSTSAVQHAGQDFRNSGTNLFHLEISFSFYCCRAESKPDRISKRSSLLLYCQNFLFSKMHSLKRFKMIINIKDLCLLYSNCTFPNSVSTRLFFQEHEEMLLLVTIKGRTWRI